MPTLSIVIPTLGRRAAFDRCLQRLEAQTHRDFDVLVVCNVDAPDPDEVAARLARTSLNGRMIRTDGVGPSASRNEGYRHATGDIVLFLDDDVLADPGLVAAHLDEHERHPEEAAGVLGTLRWADSVKVTPFMLWIEDGLQFDWVALKDKDETGWWHFYTCNVSVKRSLLERVDGFDDEVFTFGYEDLDIARRMHDENGFYLRYRSDASAEHEHSMTLDQWRERIAMFASAERKFVARYPDFEPHFYKYFTKAKAHPALRGRAAKLVDYVPRGVPYVGPRVHDHARGWYAQQLADAFLQAWEADVAAEGVQPAN